MAADSRTPLTPDQYAPGQQVKHDDQTVTIRGAVTGDHGARFLLVTAGDSLVCGLLDESLVRDEFDAVEHPQPQDNATADAPTGDPQGTGTTDGTGA